MTDGTGPDTIVEVLRARAAATPDATAFVFADSDPERVLSYAELDRRARKVAASLLDTGHRRALLMYPPGADYVTAFFGCLYAGVAAVPVYPLTGTRGAERTAGIVADAGTALVLTDRNTAETVDGDGGVLGGSTLVLRTDMEAPDPTVAQAGGWVGAAGGLPSRDDVAFLQYTSGSTGAPKGVLIGHDNLLHNLATIARTYDLGPDSLGVSWLPPYHDMGLIGGILEPVYGGFPCVLLSPMTFLRRPARWLEAISRYRATISVAPDFGYAECARRVTEAERAGLDLATWRHALVGAEPVRAATLDAFAERFAPNGFGDDVFRPCYGLAEATLLATGVGRGERPHRLEVTRDALSRGLVEPTGKATGEPTVTLVGCGHARGADVVVVVDRTTGRRCPEGTVGEIWINGPTVARGYWRTDHEVSALADASLADGGPGTDRYLRTGDLGFLWHGELYVVDRIKDLMVIRGRNHHAQDLEETVRGADPALRARGVVFGYDDGTRERVIAVQEAAPNLDGARAAAVVEAIRSVVAATHGLALDDVLLVRPGTVPYTTSGKPRRRACRELYLSGALSAALVVDVESEPVEKATAETGSGSTRSDLTRLVATALDVGPEDVAYEVPLGAQGLDSLRAARLRSTLADELGIAVSLRLLLAGTTVADLATLRRSLAPASRRYLAPRPHDGVEPAPASSGQRRMWLSDQLGAGPAYTISGAVRLTGRLDVEALRAAVGDLVRHHEALRTVVRPASDGTLVQHVLGVPEFDVPVVGLPPSDGRSWRELVEARYEREPARPFDLSRDIPVRATVLRLAADQHVLLIDTHHAAVDAWSAGLLLRDLAASYRARVSSGPGGNAERSPLRYTDYARWEAREDAGGRLAAGISFWQAALDGVQAVELPTDRPRSARPAPPAGQVRVELSPRMMVRIRQLGERTGATPFMVLLAVMGVTLGRWSGQERLAIAVPVANRHLPGIEAMVGFVANTLPLPVDLAGDPTFSEVLDRVRRDCLDAFEHADLPYERIIRETAADRDPSEFLRCALVLRERVDLGWDVKGVVADIHELLPAGAAFELALYLAPTADGGLTGSIRYAVDLFDRTTVDRVRESFGRILERAVGRPNSAVGTLPLVDGAERSRLVRSFGGADVAPVHDGTAIDLFERQVATTPDAPAIFGAERLTYRELDQRANQWAWYLRDQGIGAERVVGIQLPHSPQLVVALLAVWKAGGTYLPLDGSYPDSRLRFMVEDARPHLVLDPDRLAGAPECPVTAPPRATYADGAAYVLYTSGSTGVPKGVVNTHAGLVNHLAWKRTAIPLGPDRVVLHRTPLGFDVSITELMWPLISGACLAIPEPHRVHDLAYLTGFIREHGITDVYLVPSVLRTFLDLPDAAACGASLRRVLAAGEELTPGVVADCRRVLPDVELFNLYGPAEASIEVTASQVLPGPDSGRRVGIGRPIAGARIYVLDERDQVVPVGGLGELCVGGVPVSRGYRGRPALTADRFRPDPFEPGARLYHTGDRARWRPDGTLEFLGRVDHQVKIRGNRVEPGEVEHVLLTHPAVSAAAIDPRISQDGSVRLVAYVTYDRTALTCGEPTGTELRRFLSEKLPDYMVPTVFVTLAALPLNANGKLDRSALPEPDLREQQPHIPPRTEVEWTLAGIWAEVLGVDRVGRHDDFYALGGHSLLATQVVVRIEKTFGIRLAIIDLLSHLTLAEMADTLQRRQLTAAAEPDVRALVERIRDMPEAAVRQRLSGRWAGDRGNESR